MSKFEVYKDKKGETRFRYRAANGEIVFSSEGYKAKASAIKAIASIKQKAADAPVVEEASLAKKATSTKAAASSSSSTKKAPAAKPAAKPKSTAAKATKAAKKP
jgi:uncharacterized protein YegP (UPF0339 family)